MSSDKKDLLKNILKETLEKSKQHSKMHKKLKFWDTLLDLVVSGLSAISIALILSGVGAIFSATTGGLSFVLGCISKSLDLKSKFNIYHTTAKQYSDLSRELSTILAKNHLTNEQIVDIIEELNNRISLIEDSELEV